MKNLWCLTRTELLEHSLCAEALALFDALVVLQRSARRRAAGRLVIDWTPLAEVWSCTDPTVRSYVLWLRGRGIGPGMPCLARANLEGANLAGADLAGANLAGADLAGANLAGAYLARAYLARAYLAGANLARAYLAGANLAGAWVGSGLSGGSLPSRYRVVNGFVQLAEVQS